MFIFWGEQQDVGDGHRDLQNSAKWKKVRRRGRDYLRKLKIPAGETSYQSIYKEKDLRKT